MMQPIRSLRQQMGSRRPTTTITNIRYYKQNRFNALTAIFLVKGLIIVLIASCYMYTKLTQHVVSVDVDACVRKVENKCELYPCQVQYNGAIEEIESPSPYFGYGGHFVHREENIGKALPESKCFYQYCAYYMHIICHFYELKACILKIRNYGMHLFITYIFQTTMQLLEILVGILAVY